MLLLLRFKSEVTLKKKEKINLFSLPVLPLTYLFFSFYFFVCRSHVLNIKQENKYIYHLGLRRSTGAHTRQRAKPNNLFKRFLFTIVLSYFIRQSNMTPRVRLRVHAAWSWDVFLALTRCEFLPRLCSKLPGAETLPSLLLFSQPFSQHLSWFCIWGRSCTDSLRKGMVTACLLSPKSEYNRKYNELWHQLFPYGLSLLFIPSRKKNNLKCSYIYLFLIYLFYFQCYW